MVVVCIYMGSPEEVKAGNKPEGFLQLTSTPARI